jgi:aromatic ring-opening dioxygenase LigB subunit
MISFALLLPYSPELISLREEKNVSEAFKEVNQLVNKLQPDILLTISSQGPFLKQAFSLNLSQEYKIDFKDLGDLKTKISFQGNLELNYKIKENFEINSPETPLTMITEPELDSSLAVPLYYLYQKYKNFSLIPIYSCLLDYQKHFDFGQQLKEELVLTNKKIGLLVPYQFNLEELKEEKNNFNQDLKKKVLKSIEEKNLKALVKINPELITKAKMVDFPSLLILSGILKDLSYQLEIIQPQPFLDFSQCGLIFKLL